jgi:hypothetical protein
LFETGKSERRDALKSQRCDGFIALLSRKPRLHASQRASQKRSDISAEIDPANALTHAGSRKSARGGGGEKITPLMKRFELEANRNVASRVTRSGECFLCAVFYRKLQKKPKFLDCLSNCGKE